MGWKGPPRRLLQALEEARRRRSPALGIEAGRMIMAAGLLITVPTVGFFIAVQQRLIQGWGSGGIKG